MFRGEARWCYRNTVWRWRPRTALARSRGSVVAGAQCRCCNAFVGQCVFSPRLTALPVQGVAGLYDYGPPGTAIKANLLSHWRNHFILEEDMLEIETTSVTPSKVFEVSGHCAKFTDFMVRNDVTKAYYRADHLLEQHIDKLLEDPKLSREESSELKRIAAQVDDYDVEALGALLKKFDVRDPEDGGALSAPYAFNLMFETSIGPAGSHRGYLRPETAQGIFVNFARLLEFNGGKVPFAGATIGPAFRNEISPRAGLLRVREFTLAEIEHFIDPKEDTHQKFERVADVVLTLFPRDHQTTTGTMVRMKVGDAVRGGIIGGQNLGYFMARTFLFLVDMGVRLDGVRFRQHLGNEMAHYAVDCWDAELLTSYGWIECVGHANRSCYDLTVHAGASGANMHFFKSFAEPIQREVLRAKVNRGLVGTTFKASKADGKALVDYLEQLIDGTAVALQDALRTKGVSTVHVNGRDFELTDKMVSFHMVKEKISGESVTPAVIEPSYGIGRIIYALLEQSYWVRNEDEPHRPMSEAELRDRKTDTEKNTKMMRGVLSLAPALAPTKCSVIPLYSSHAEMVAYLPRVTDALKRLNITHKVDRASQNIGRRYARTDELGIPYGITVDHDTIGEGPLKDSVTLRDRDSTGQVRVPTAEVAAVVLSLTAGTVKWADVAAKYPPQAAPKGGE